VEHRHRTGRTHHLLDEHPTDVRVAATAGAQYGGAAGEIGQVLDVDNEAHRGSSSCSSPTALTWIRVALPGRYASGTSSTSTTRTVPAAAPAFTARSTASCLAWSRTASRPPSAIE